MSAAVMADPTPPAAAVGGRAALDAALVEAHAAGDTAALARLYAEAAAGAEGVGDGEAAAFYRTHAYVFALESGSPLADGLHAALLAAGREE
ncbi:MAG: hypothetical protein AAFR52_16180 [Pseudomonadota bacterium]